MTLKSQALIFKAAPKLFKGNKLYIECGDGWFGIILDLVRRIEQCELSGPAPVITQIKEKFGELRVYGFNFNDSIIKLIDEAEEQSHTICEHCGLPGQLRNDGWLSTMCNDCWKEKHPREDK